MQIARQNETKEMFEKNLQLLEPWQQELVLKINEEALWKRIEVTYTDDGYPVCRYRQGDKTFQIVSEQPVAEAKIWCKSVLDQASGVVFLFGSGFGYPLFEIFAHKMPHTLVIVFEQDLFLFKALLYYFDFKPVIQSGKLILFIGDSHHFEQAFSELFSSLNFFSCTYPTFCFTPVAQRNFKVQYQKIYEFVLTRLSLLTFYIGNDHLDNLIGLCNLIANAGTIVCNPNISCLKDQYKGTPAFIVANGPSLDKNIGQLEKIQGKGLIISVESAIVPLIKNGIKPDILTIIERSKETYSYHFENRNLPDDMALICLGMVDRQVFPAFKGAKIPVFRSGEAINQWVNDNIGDGSAIDAGSNVSHLALELAAYVGANPIVFVGQDYAYGAKGTTHSRDASYYEKTGEPARALIESLPVIYVEGNDGSQIPSNPLWRDFKLGLEIKIASHPDILFLNATEGGAKIAGTKCLTLAKIIEQYCIEKIPYRVNQLINDNRKQISFSNSIMRLTGFVEDAEKYASLFRGFVQSTVEGKLDCKNMIQFSQMVDEKTYEAIINEAYKRHLAVFDTFLSNGLCRHFIQQMFFVYYYLMNRIGRIDKADKVTEIFKLQYDLFYYLNIVNQSMCIHLENAVESLRAQLELLKMEQGG
ncbi:MAG TPA: 6-hydroxymethylpterin diphosphokinase MptE-like protein [Clostridia bacterium]|nr:6-hydroxymethylpterin diphosphokinase MptE-like protein [Clostridia bacterium]